MSEDVSISVAGEGSGAEPSSSRSHQRRLISIAAVLDRIPISNATMWREIAAGRFPKPVRIAARRVGIFEDEIDLWLAKRVAERDVA